MRRVKHAKTETQQLQVASEAGGLTKKCLRLIEAKKTSPLSVVECGHCCLVFSTTCPVVWLTSALLQPLFG